MVPLTLWKPPVFVKTIVSPKLMFKEDGTKLLLLFAITECVVEFADKAKKNIAIIV